MASTSDSRDTRSRRAEEIALALALTLAVVLLNSSRLLQTAWLQYLSESSIWTYRTVVELAVLAVGLILALSARHRSGLTVGHRPPSWALLAALVVLTPLIVGVVYAALPERPFSMGSRSSWIVSPTAQEIWFLGYLYGRLEAVFPGDVHPRAPVRRALLVTGLFFSLMHLLLGMYGVFSSFFVAFQVVYTFVGFVVVGLSRQWTGSILYAVVVHTAVNYVTWRIPY